MTDDVISVNSENAAEFYAAKMNPSNAFPVVAETPEVAAPSLEENTEVEEENANPAEDQKQANPKIEKRIDQLTKQREDAKRDTAAEREARMALEKRIAELETKNAPQLAVKAVAQEGKPQPNQFNDAYQYAEALAEWSAENALQKRDKQVQEESSRKIWNERQEVAKAEYEDYQDALSSSTVQVSDAAKGAILDSEAGPKILYHLAKNPDIAEAWAKKSDMAVIREIGRLEEKLSSTKQVLETPAVKVSKAPEPINPIRATNAGSGVLDATGNVVGSYDDFKKAYNAGKIR